MALSLYTPSDVSRALADRARARRLDRGWTQQECAERAGIALSTLKVFEHSGKISLERLLRLALVLGDLESFLLPLAPPPARSLDEIASRIAEPRRKYGVRRPRTKD